MVANSKVYNQIVLLHVCTVIQLGLVYVVVCRGYIRHVSCHAQAKGALLKSLTMKGRFEKQKDQKLGLRFLVPRIKVYLAERVSSNKLKQTVVVHGTIQCTSIKTD